MYATQYIIPIKDPIILIKIVNYYSQNYAEILGSGPVQRVKIFCPLIEESTF